MGMTGGLVAPTQRRTDAIARPQPGIFAQGTRSHYHLDFDLKPDNVELTDDVKPETAHSARVVEKDGEELEIYRRRTPYGWVGELGLSFVAFSAERSRSTKMLHRFAPSLDALEGILPSE
jgi:deferrochelatase/peroxidase EfeB